MKKAVLTLCSDGCLDYVGINEYCFSYILLIYCLIWRLSVWSILFNTEIYVSFWLTYSPDDEKKVEPSVSVSLPVVLTEVCVELTHTHSRRKVLVICVVCSLCKNDLVVFDSSPLLLPSSDWPVTLKPWRLDWGCRSLTWARSRRTCGRPESALTRWVPHSTITNHWPSWTTRSGLPVSGTLFSLILDRV